MAYVENLAAFLEDALSFSPGLHTYNYIDKPDFEMNSLVGHVNKALGKSARIPFRLPYFLGYGIGLGFDLVARLIGRKFSISSIRIKKFCSTTSFASSVTKSGFEAPVSLEEGLHKTITFEFVDRVEAELFYSE